MKKEIIIDYYEHCGECWHAGEQCDLTNKIIPDMWGKIPSWCPLEDVPTKDQLLKQKVIKY